MPDPASGWYTGDTPVEECATWLGACDACARGLGPTHRHQNGFSCGYYSEGCFTSAASRELGAGEYWELRVLSAGGRKYMCSPRIGPAMGMRGEDTYARTHLSLGIAPVGMTPLCGSPTLRGSSWLALQEGTVMYVRNGSVIRARDCGNLEHRRLRHYTWAGVPPEAPPYDAGDRIGFWFIPGRLSIFKNGERVYACGDLDAQVRYCAVACLLSKPNAVEFASDVSFSVEAAARAPTHSWRCPGGYPAGRYFRGLCGPPPRRAPAPADTGSDSEEECDFGLFDEPPPHRAPAPADTGSDSEECDFGFFD